MTDPLTGPVEAPPFLLHMTTATPWRIALATGSLIAPSLVTDGFIHLSSVDQVTLPANRLYAGRDDLLLLVLDPARLGSEVRWEPGVPTDPGSMRFPHLYGPLPAAAVTSVVPWRPGPDGTFTPPTGLPAPSDPIARALAFDRSLAERRAAVVLPVTGGVAVLDPRFPSSWEHNGCWFAGAVPPVTVQAECDRVLGGAGLRHRRAIIDDEGLARALGERGWEIEEERLLVLEPEAPTPFRRGAVVEVVPTAAMHAMWEASWRRDFPADADDAIAQLVAREVVSPVVLRVLDVVNRADDGRIVASAQVRIDGATAVVEAVMTEPDARGAGRATAVVGETIRLAREAGCDVIWLIAIADDWPRRWYERLGFVDVGVRWSAVRHPSAG